MEKKEIILIILGGATIVLLLVLFLLVFFMLLSRRQQSYLLEKAKLQSDFDQEILQSKNQVQEHTMRHIARELHDNVGQMLSLVKIQLNNIEEENPGIKRVKDSREFLNKALVDIRSLSKTLNADHVLQNGLQEAIAFELSNIDKTGIIQTHFNDETSGRCLNTGVEVIVFRIVQETLQNTLKHAKAKNVWVSLVETADLCILDVHDDGCGFDLSVKKGMASGSGLLNMHNRAQLIKCTYEIKSSISSGTTTRLMIPKNQYDKGSTDR